MIEYDCKCRTGERRCTSLDYSNFKIGLSLAVACYISCLPIFADENRYGKLGQAIEACLRLHWFPPKEYHPDPVTLRFGVDKSGRLEWIQLRKGSRNTAANDAAVLAVLDSAPYLPLPLGSPDKAVLIVQFDYSVVCRDQSFVFIDSNVDSPACSGKVWVLPDTSKQAQAKRLVYAGFNAAHHGDFERAEHFFEQSSRLDANDVSTKVNRDLCADARLSAGPPMLQRRFAEHEAWGAILNRIWIEHGKELEMLKADGRTRQRYVDLVNSLLVRPVGK